MFSTGDSGGTFVQHKCWGFRCLFSFVLAASIVLKYVSRRTYRLLLDCAMSLLHSVVLLQCSPAVLRYTSQGGLVPI